MNFGILEIILIVFFTSLIVTVFFRQMRLSVILGYLLVGALVGPHALGWVPDSPRISELAEFGIVFLMFTVGLEFSIPKLASLRKSVFIIGGLQVVLTILITTVIGNLIGMSWTQALIVGSVAAMSSTAIVVKQLSDQHELGTVHGLNSVGILLFQDLAVVPVIILIASFADTSQNISFILLWALIKGIIAILLIFMMGRWLLRPLFHLIAKTRAIELFTLNVLLVTLTAAWLTHLLGLSFALGAFLAGIMLSETEFRHQIEVEIRPFRDILLGLFFITIGMLTDVRIWSETWVWIALLLGAIVFVKMMLITFISYFNRIDIASSLRTGLILAQGGEFGFAILTLSLNHHLLPPNYGQVVLAALLLSIMLSPFLIFFNKNISAFFLPKSTQYSEEFVYKTISTIAKKLHNHVIICGYGRVGQHVARMLDKLNIPYIGMDLDSKLVERASLAGDDVIYGDASHPEILKAAGIKNARVLVISLSDHSAATRILSIVKQNYPKLPIIVRCRDEVELKQLKELHPSQIIAELFEASLSISYHLLHFLNLPQSKIAAAIQDVRNSDYDLLQKVFTGTPDKMLLQADQEDKEQLRPIAIYQGAYAEGKKLSELDLSGIGVEIIAIRRGRSKHVKPEAKTKIRANDVIILYGSDTEVERAESKLLKGEDL